MRDFLSRDSSIIYIYIYIYIYIQQFICIEKNKRMQIQYLQPNNQLPSKLACNMTLSHAPYIYIFPTSATNNMIQLWCGMSSTQSGCCIGSDSIDGFGFLSPESFRPIG